MDQGEVISRRWPLVARRAELDAAQRALRSSHAVLIGPPGVGKTRVGRELAEWGAEQGWHVETIAATRASAAVPLAALAPLLPPLQHATQEALIRLTPRHLSDRAAGRQVLLVVDDAHFLDDASCILIHLLAMTPGTAVVATVATGHPVPDSITALWKDGHAARIELHPFSRDELRSLLAQVFERPIDPAVEARLWELSLGNALFLRELVVSNVESGALVTQDGILRWRSEPLVAPRLQDLIKGRIATLLPAEQAALETIALSEPIEIALLETLCDPKVLEALERRQLVTISDIDGHPAVRLVHPMHGQVIRAGIPTAAAERIYSCLARALADTGTSAPEDTFRLVSWRIAAREPVDRDLLSAAAMRAWQLGLMATCERFAAAAVDAGADVFTLVLLAQAKIRQGRAHEALDPLRQRLALEPEGPAREMLVAALGVALSWGCGLIAEARDVLYSGATDHREQPMRFAMVAVTDALAGDIARAVEGAEAVLSATSEVLATSYSYSALAATIFGSGDLALSQRLVATGRPDEETALLPFAFVRKVSNHSVALAAHGRVHEAIAFAEPHYRTSVDASDDPSRVRWAYVLGFAHLLAGDFAHAAQLLADSCERSYTCEPCISDIAGPMAFIAHWMRGDRNPPRPEANRWPLGLCLEHLTNGLIAASEQRTADENQLMQRGIEAARTTDMPLFELIISYFSIRQGRAAKVAASVASAAKRMGGPLAELIDNHAKAASARDGLALQTCADGYLALGYRWFACDAFAQASAIHRTAGRKTAAASTAQAARELGSNIGIRVDLLEDLELDDPLTSREREVATWVVEGHTNQEVAAKLFLSVRTVDAHLRSVYQKLGINSRAELADHVRARGQRD